jgi:hypothetical protein
MLDAKPGRSAIPVSSILYLTHLIDEFSSQAMI